MSKVLLIAVNAKYIHSNPAVYSLGAYAREALEQLPGVEIEIAEYTINQNTETILGRYLQAQATGCGIFLLYLELEYGTGAASGAAEASAGYKALAGGPEVSFHAEEILNQYPCLTGIMIGEGEETFTELVRFYQTGEGKLTDVRGLVLPTGRTRTEG